MRGKATALFAVFLVVPSVVTFVRLSEAASNTSDYKLVTKITLGGEGGWDYFGVDPSTGHVFIPRGDHILVVDSSGKQLADVGKAHDTHAIAFAPEIKTAYLSAQDSVDVLDLEKTRTPSSTMPPANESSPSTVAALKTPAQSTPARAKLWAASHLAASRSLHKPMATDTST